MHAPKLFVLFISVNLFEEKKTRITKTLNLQKMRKNAVSAAQLLQSELK